MKRWLIRGCIFIVVWPVVYAGVTLLLQKGSASSEMWRKNFDAIQATHDAAAMECFAQGGLPERSQLVVSSDAIAFPREVLRTFVGCVKPLPVAPIPVEK